jgi:hypothetical protein
MKKTALHFLVIIVFLPEAVSQNKTVANDTARQTLPVYLRDRGTGIYTSIFGTYVRHRELLVHPFFEYYLNNDQEYKPGDFVNGPEIDYRGRFRASEELLFIGYGLTDWLAIEFEAALIQATQYKSPKDNSVMPQKFSESGIGDVQSEFNFRWQKEGPRRPELFSYFEIVYPTRGSRKMIGTGDWEFKLGTGLIRGFHFGTITLRTSLEYPLEDGKLSWGGFAVEYLKRLSSKWRIYIGVEANQDEVEFITEAQWHIKDRIYFRFNNGFGITSKATDWAPDTGIVFSFK